MLNEVFLRLLGRAATPREIEATLALLKKLPEEHQRLAARLQRREVELARVMAEGEERRRQAIARAKGVLETYEREIAPRLAEQERRRGQRIVQQEAALGEYERLLPQKLTTWERQAAKPTASWVVLDPAELAATNGAQLTKQADVSVLVSGPNGKGSYRFSAAAGVTEVTGVRLEALADDRLPSKGPGRAANGNFVVSEFRLEWAPQGEPMHKIEVVLENARADFSQSDYDVKTAIGGKRDKGWAISPKTGETHTAVFETHQNVGAKPGIFTFILAQEYPDGQHSLGRFRISVTNSPRPITLQGLPKNIADILASAGEKRTDRQKAELFAYYRGADPELKRRREALAAARRPSPVDPKVQALRDALTEAGRLLAIDPDLLRLRRNVQLSAKQLENARLTFAQDLAWALINSPAFLFNR